MTGEQYALARARFEATAGMDAPDLPEDHVEALQTRLWRWQVKSYGCPQDGDLVAGIVEELGEWRAAQLACDHGEVADAIADTAIYAIQLCTNLRLDAETLLAPPAAFVVPRDPLVIAGRLSHISLKTRQKIRGMGDREASRRAHAAALVDLFAWLHRQARVPLLRLVADVAEVVMLRVPSKLPQVAA